MDVLLIGSLSIVLLLVVIGDVVVMLVFKKVLVIEE